MVGKARFEGSATATGWIRLGSLLWHQMVCMITTSLKVALKTAMGIFFQVYL